MSMFNFFWDITQEDRIDKLEKRVVELEEQMAMAAKWIMFLSTNGKEIVVKDDE